jgi:ribulose-bisphosphate carboxylase large chain
MRQHALNDQELVTGLLKLLQGTRAGAKATMQAIEAWQEGMTLEEKAKTVKELGEALGKWGHYKPK